MLRPKLRGRLSRSLRFGCLLRLLPYRWEHESNSPLSPTNRTDLRIFHFHQIVMTSYSVYMTFRLMHASIKSEHFPLQQRLLSTLWTNAYVLTAVGFFQLDLRRVEIMRFANKILYGNILNTPTKKKKRRHTRHKRDNRTLKRIEKKNRKKLSWHIYIALFLLYSNPGSHTLVQSDSPCAPHFISSSILNCKSISDNVHSLMEKLPFAVFELYTVFMFLYICCFHWTFIMLGLTTVATDLKKMRQVRMRCISRRGKWNTILQEYHKLNLLMNLVNDIFRYYLMVFPSILFFILSMLLFGTIRLWRESLHKNLMFPLCGLRCGFEAVTPLATAGNVNREKPACIRQMERSDEAVYSQAEWKRKEGYKNVTEILSKD